jgi:hypothetical protein
MENSCIAAYFVFRRKHLVIEIPGIRSISLGHFLDCVADMDHHMIAGSDFFMLQKEQADRAFDPFRLASRHETVTFHDPHGHTKAHDASTIADIEDETLGSANPDAIEIGQ